MMQRRKSLIKGLHAKFVLAGLHHRIDLMDLVLADQVSDSGIGDKDLKGHNAAVARCFW